jgi:hypothetical protein
MRHLSNELLAITTLTVLSLGAWGCSGAPDSDADGADTALLSAAPEEHDDGMTEGEESTRPPESAEREESRERGEHDEPAESRESGEHREGGEAGEHEELGHDEEGEGEESGVYIGRAETWDTTRRGAHLVLRFDSESDVFAGTVRNTTNGTLCAVRVEVHLSSGLELGPTERTDLAAGESTEVRLPVATDSFESWTAHPEVSSCDN